MIQAIDRGDDAAVKMPSTVQVEEDLFVTDEECPYMKHLMHSEHGSNCRLVMYRERWDKPNTAVRAKYDIAEGECLYINLVENLEHPVLRRECQCDDCLYTESSIGQPRKYMCRGVAYEYTKKLL